MSNFDYIIKALPYKTPFLFVDDILQVSDDHIKGCYTLKTDEYFYEGHFPGQPVTPGVIITEIMAQIGLVSFGLHLLSSQKSLEPVLPVFTSSHVDYLAPSYPGDKLMVSSEKVYFRFGKLKCKISCFNENTGKEVCRGEFSGMLIDANEFGR